MVSGQERLVQSQERFRRANERLHERVTNAPRTKRIPFLCECPEESCTAPVPLTLDEYAEIRDSDTRFVIVPGHPTVDGEDVLSENERYAVVEKLIAWPT